MEFSCANDGTVRLKGTAEDKSDFLTILQFAKNYGDIGTYAGVTSEEIDNVEIKEMEGLLEFSDKDLTRTLMVITAMRSLGARNFEIAGLHKSFADIDDETSKFRHEIIPPNHADCDF